MPERSPGQGRRKKGRPQGRLDPGEHRHTGTAGKQEPCGGRRGGAPTATAQAEQSSGERRQHRCPVGADAPPSSRAGSRASNTGAHSSTAPSPRPDSPWSPHRQTLTFQPLYAAGPRPCPRTPKHVLCAEPQVLLDCPPIPDAERTVRFGHATRSSGRAPARRLTTGATVLPLCYHGGHGGAEEAIDLDAPRP